MMPKNLVAATLGISALLIFRCSSRSGGLLMTLYCVAPEVRLLKRNQKNVEGLCHGRQMAEDQ